MNKKSLEMLTVVRGKIKLQLESSEFFNSMEYLRSSTKIEDFETFSLYLVLQFNPEIYYL